MALPSVTETLRDNALGILPDNVDDVHVVVGVCSGGTPNQLYSAGDQQTLLDTLIGGPGVEAAAVSLQDAGGPIYVMPITASVAGTVSAVTKSNGSAPTMTVAGAPADTYQATITITRTGTLGVGGFTYSLDGGDVTSEETGLPSAGLQALDGTGLSLAFPAGTYTAGDTYTFTTVGPGFNTTNLTDAFAALLADQREWKFVHVVGAASSVAGSVTVATLLDGQMTAAFNGHRFAYVLMEAPDDTDANLIAGYASFASAYGRVHVAAGYEEVASPISGRIYKRSTAWKTAARYSKRPISQHAGDVTAGPLTSVDSTRMYRDERKTPGLDAARFVTHTTIIGRQGAYITRGRTMAPAGSDFDQVQRVEVMNVACRVARNAALSFLNTSVRVSATTGFIDERDALTIERAIDGALETALVAAGHASDASVTVKRDENMLSSGRLVITVRVLPLAYAEYITLDLGFTNPALSPVAR